MRLIRMVLRPPLRLLGEVTWPAYSRWGTMGPTSMRLEMMVILPLLWMLREITLIVCITDLRLNVDALDRPKKKIPISSTIQLQLCGSGRPPQVVLIEQCPSFFVECPSRKSKYEMGRFVDSYVFQGPRFFAHVVSFGIFYSAQSPTRFGEGAGDCRDPQDSESCHWSPIKTFFER